ncbi:MAG: hypothetical protein LBQ62_07320 [Candidatus Accumulibacter sp.]|jgi:hypothetical protein|nr:hypothetical protein [Accumulibacter sp.]
MPPPDLPSRPESPRLRKDVAKFAIAVTVWLASSCLMVNIPDAYDSLWMAILFVPFMASLVCAICCFFDIFRALRFACARWRFLRLVFGIPQFLFGFLCFVMGLAINVWISFQMFYLVEFLLEVLGRIQTLAFMLLLLALCFIPAIKLSILNVFGYIFLLPLLEIARPGYRYMETAFQADSSKKEDGGGKIS